MVAKEVPEYAPDPERDGHVSQQSWIGICFFNALIVINQTCFCLIFSPKKEQKFVENQKKWKEMCKRRKTLVCRLKEI